MAQVWSAFDKLTWLLEFEGMIADIMTKWTGIIIIAGDTNIDLLCNEKDSQKRYKEILSCYNLTQLLNKPTRKSKTLTDHIVTNIPNKLVLTDVLKTDEISDHSTPYVIMNVKKEKFEPRYKFIRDEKNFNQNDFPFRKKVFYKVTHFKNHHKHHHQSSSSSSSLIYCFG